MAKYGSKTLTLRPVNSDHTVRLLEVIEQYIRKVDVIASYNSEMLQFKIKGDREDTGEAIGMIRSLYSALKTSMFPDNNGLFTHDFRTIELLTKITANNELVLNLLRLRGFQVSALSESGLFTTDASIDVISDAMKEITSSLQTIPRYVKSPLMRRIVALLSLSTNADVNDVIELGIHIGIFRDRKKGISLTQDRNKAIEAFISTVTEHGSVVDALKSVMNNQDSDAYSLEVDSTDTQEFKGTGIVLKSEKLKEWAKEAFEEGEEDSI